MPIETNKVTPSNLMIFISDPDAVNVPDQGEPIRIRATSEIITVPSRYWNEGDIEISLGNYREVRLDRPPDFDTVVNTPNHRIIVSDVDMTEYLGRPVAGSQTRIRIWTNDPQLPDRIIIDVGD